MRFAACASLDDWTLKLMNPGTSGLRMTAQGGHNLGRGKAPVSRLTPVVTYYMLYFRAKSTHAGRRL